MIGKTRRVGWLKAAAAMVGGLLTTAASAQQPPAAPSAPVRAVYVTAQDGNSKVYYVTGMVPQEKVPTPAPAALPPSSVKPLLPLPAPIKVNPAAPVAYNDAPPAVLPPATGAYAPAEPAIATPISPPNAKHGKGGGCANGHCDKGPTSFSVCMRTPATVPPPLGSSVRGVFDMQRENALGEYFVVYREDFLEMKFTLNESGERHVDGIIRRLGLTGAPIKLEPTGIAELDSRRHMAIVAKLIDGGMSPQDAGTRVIAGTTRAEGLRYHEIENLNNRTGGTGTFGNGGYGSFSSFGGYGSGYGGIGGFR